jgi:hypothetical protein
MTTFDSRIYADGRHTPRPIFSPSRTPCGSSPLHRVDIFLAEGRGRQSQDDPIIDSWLHAVAQPESGLLTSENFNRAVKELAVLAGFDVGAALNDEHVRWSLYETSMVDPSRRRLLRDAVRGESSIPLASAAVVRIIEAVPDGERAEWVELLPAGRLREFAASRAAELRVLEDLAADVGTGSRSQEIEGWSQWLQLRVAEEIERPEVLDALARLGATRRIRRLAREGLDRLP